MARHPSNRLAVAAAALLLALTTACSSSGDARPPGPGAATPGPVAGDATVPPPQAGPPAWGGELCSQPAVTCAEHAGLPTVLVARPGSRLDDVVLVDLGGPGTSVEQTLERLADLDLFAGHDVLVVGEAWEVTPPTDACLSAEAARVASWAAITAPGSSTGASCDPSRWRFVPADYRAAVADALAPSHGRVTSGVGVSFGAVRVAAALTADVPLLLLSPAPVAGSSGAVDAARADAVLQRARALCAGRPACTGVLDRLGAGRSLEARDYEAALALVGSAPDPDLLRETVAALGARTGTGSADTLTRQAYAATFRYGDGAVLPNLLSYRAGTCGWYSGTGAPSPTSPTSEADATGGTGLAALLDAVLSCGAGPTTPPAIDLVGRRGCVVTARDDVVTPPALTRPWTSGGSALVLRAGGMSAHGALDGTAASLLSRVPASLSAC